MDQELRDYLDEQFKSIDERFKAVDERFKSVDERFNEASEQLQEFRQETAGHFEQVETDVRQTRVVVESVQVQIQLVAEALVGSNESRERFQQEVTNEFKEARATRDLHFSHLDRRVKKLEEAQLAPKRSSSKKRPSSRAASR
jgi:archaellum component FlaC